MTKIIDCNCPNAQQDAIHGPGRRVANRMAKKLGDNTLWRCTSCGTEKTTGGNAPAKGKKS